MNKFDRPINYHELPRAAQDAWFRENASEAAIGKVVTSSWSEPKSIPDGLASVMDFDIDFLPKSIAPWVGDITERMQCPPDFVAVSAIVALGAVLGRKVGIRPQRQNDWLVISNFWGCLTGRPGMMKSPAMEEALKPLHRLEKTAREAHNASAAEYARELELFKLKLETARDAARKALKSGLKATLSDDLVEPEEPKAKRYLLNDTTYEQLGVVMANNPNGVLAFRDELVSLLKTLDREEYCAARGFFLQAWSGTSSYTFDRVNRGQTHIEGVCLSLLGSTQPGRLAEYVRRAVSGGAGDDGLIQRFGLLVWPDQGGDWKECDRWPDTAARETAWGTFERLDRLDVNTIGAERDKYEGIPFLRFDDQAQEAFSEWRGNLEMRLRSSELAPSFESHLAKYRKLVPALALIDHLTDGGVGAIGETSLLRALAMIEYLETHARRAYGAGLAGEAAIAKLIRSRIRKGDLADGFTARDIQRKNWSGLTDLEAVKAALDLLADLDWVRPKTTDTGGRPSISHAINPRAMR